MVRPLSGRKAGVTGTRAEVPSGHGCAPGAIVFRHSHNHTAVVSLSCGSRVTGVTETLAGRWPGAEIEWCTNAVM